MKRRHEKDEQGDRDCDRGTATMCRHTFPHSAGHQDIRTARDGGCTEPTKLSYLAMVAASRQSARCERERPASGPRKPHPGAASASRTFPRGVGEPGRDALVVSERPGTRPANADA